MSFIDLKKTGASPDREKRLWGSVAVEVAEATNRFVFYVNSWLVLAVNKISGKVCNAVAETIDVNDAALMLPFFKTSGFREVFNRTSLLMSGPSSSGLTPVESAAATGAKISRP